MKLLFVDESGFSPNWTRDINEQPFYVVAAVCVDAERYTKACQNLRIDIDFLNVPSLEFPLGQGSEFKARDVGRGSGWWANNNAERNRFRELMLNFPIKNDGVGFVVVVDKARHYNKFRKPEHRVSLGMSYLFERAEFYLRQMDSDAFCIYDHDKQRTDELQSQSITLIREGSKITFVVPSSGQRTEITHSLSRFSGSWR